MTSSLLVVHTARIFMALPIKQNLRRIVRLIRASLAKRETRVLPRKVWEGVKVRDWEADGDVMIRIAEAAQCDWLLHNETGEARFFEPN